MLRIEGKSTPMRDEVARRPAGEGEGLLLLAVLAGSWVIAFAVGWVIWRMSPL